MRPGGSDVLSVHLLEDTARHLACCIHIVLVFLGGVLRLAKLLESVIISGLVEAVHAEGFLVRDVTALIVVAADSGVNFGVLAVLDQIIFVLLIGVGKKDLGVFLVGVSVVFAVVKVKDGTLGHVEEGLLGGADRVLRLNRHMKWLHGLDRTTADDLNGHADILELDAGLEGLRAIDLFVVSCVDHFVSFMW